MPYIHSLDLPQTYPLETRRTHLSNEDRLSSAAETAASRDWVTNFAGEATRRVMASFAFDYMPDVIRGVQIYAALTDPAYGHIYGSIDPAPDNTAKAAEESVEQLLAGTQGYIAQIITNNISAILEHKRFSRLMNDIMEKHGISHGSQQKYYTLAGAALMHYIHIETAKPRDEQTDDG